MQSWSSAGRSWSVRIGVLSTTVAVLAAFGCTPAPRPASTPTVTHAALQGAPASASGFAFRPLPCDSLPLTQDSVLDTLFLSVDAPLSRQSLPPRYINQLLDALHSAMEIPRPLVLPVFTAGGVASGDGASLHPTIAGEAEFTLRDTGAVVGATVTSSLSGVFDRALADAPHRADSLHILPPRLGLRSPGHPVQFFATVLSTRPHGVPSVPLVAVRVPTYAQSRDAEPVEPADADSSARLAGSHDETVVVEVVIDERGHPVFSTLRLVEAHYREFARSAAQRLQAASYRPASIGACAVRAIARLRYRFAVAN